MKKLISVILAAALVLCCFAGCGDKVTAESLLEGAFGKDPVTSADVSIDFDFSGTISMSWGEEASSMDFAVGLNADIRSAGDITAVDGTLSYNMFGMNIDTPMKTYVTVSGSETTTYSYDPDSELWVYSVSTEQNDMDFSKLSSIKLSDFVTSCELSEFKKGDPYYVVNAVINTDALSSSDADIGELTGALGLEADTLKGAKFNAALYFDASGKLLSKIVLTGDKDTIKIEDTSVAEFTATLTINKLNSVSVSIPEDVKNNAVSEDELPDSSDWDDTDWNWGDDSSSGDDDWNWGDSDTGNDDDWSWGDGETDGDYSDYSEIEYYDTWDYELWLEGNYYYFAEEYPQTLEDIGMMIYDGITVKDVVYYLWSPIRYSITEDMYENYVDVEGVEVEVSDYVYFWDADYDVLFRADNADEDTAISLADSSLTEISFNVYDGITFDLSGLNENSTCYDVVELFGAPSTAYSADGSYSLSYSSNTNTFVSFAFYSDTLTIASIDIDDSTVTAG